MNPAAEGFLWTVLPRHGRRPLGFTGRMLFEARNSVTSLPLASHIAVFETRDTRFVASISHQGTPAGVFAYADARLCNTAEEVHAVFRSHHPDAHMPPELLAPNWTEAEATPAGTTSALTLRHCEQQLARIRAEWQMLLTGVFGELATSG